MQVAKESFKMIKAIEKRQGWKYIEMTSLREVAPISNNNLAPEVYVVDIMSTFTLLLDLIIYISIDMCKNLHMVNI